MFHQYRDLEKGEFFLAGGDCSQGGSDSNECHFMSYQKKDFPLVYRARGVAANMTDAVQPMLEWVYDKTGVKPVVGFERNNGGGSEMKRLYVLNRNKKYTCFVMPRIGTDEDEDEVDTNQLGYNTTSSSRPTLIGDWKNAVDNSLVIIYDKVTIDQHKTFIVNKVGKPIASGTNHDDAVIAPAIAYQMFQICKPPRSNNDYKALLAQLPKEHYNL